MVLIMIVTINKTAEVDYNNHYQQAHPIDYDSHYQHRSLFKEAINEI